MTKPTILSSIAFGNLCDEVVGDLILRGIWPGYSKQDQRSYESFLEALRVDGADLVEGRIVPFLSPSVEPGSEQGVLESRLKQYGIEVASNHLNNALDLASNSKWEPANGEVRSFLESTCEAIAARIYSGLGDPPVRGEARKFLAEQGFLNNKESDLLRCLFQILHGEGGHAGTSSSDDCHRRRLMAVAMANYYLERLDYWLASERQPSPSHARNREGFWIVANPCHKSVHRNCTGKQLNESRETSS